MAKFKRLILLLLSCSVLGALSTHSTLADSSLSFDLDINKINNLGEFSTSSSYQLNDTLTFLDSTNSMSSSFLLVDSLVEMELYCGNGVVEATETCDDGNTSSNDGCSSSCQIESSSSTSTSTPAPVYGGGSARSEIDEEPVEPVEPLETIEQEEEEEPQHVTEEVLEEIVSDFVENISEQFSQETDQELVSDLIEETVEALIEEINIAPQEAPNPETIKIVIEEFAQVLGVSPESPVVEEAVNQLISDLTNQEEEEVSEENPPKPSTVLSDEPLQMIEKPSEKQTFVLSVLLILSLLINAYQIYRSYRLKNKRNK